MRVGIVAPPAVPVPPPAYGGTETVVDCLARGLAATHHEVLLATTGDASCPVSRTWVFPEAVGTSGWTPPAEIQHVVGAYDALRAWGADVVHDHTLTGPMYASRLDVPTVTTNHLPFNDGLAEYYRRISSLTSVIAISQSQAAAAPSVPIAAVIHHGIDIDAVPFGEGRGGYAAFLARMDPEKGAHIAARIARAAGIPLKMAARLRGPRERAYFEAHVVPLLGDRIEYLGELETQAKYRLLGGARCLINPVRWPEPFGIAMVEALACGTPVVGTPLGAVPELIEDGVTGFVRASEEDLVEAVHEAGELDRRSCRDAAKTRFSMARMVERHVRLYEKVLGAPRGPRRAA